MKRILSILVMLVFTSSIVASAAESRLQNYVNKKIAPLTQKEQEFNAKIEAQKQADAKKRAEYEKKQAEKKAAMEASRKEAEARQAKTKKAIENEVNFWQSILKK